MTQVERDLVLTQAELTKLRVAIFELAAKWRAEAASPVHPERRRALRSCEYELEALVKP